MILSVSEQVVVFLWTTVCGMAAAFVYDLFRIFRKAVKTGSLVTFIQDMLYWIIAAVIMFITVFWSNDGELRGFLFLGALIGAVLYALMFSRAIMSSSLFIIRLTARIIRFISFIVSYPFKMIIKLIAIPARKLVSICVAEIRKARDRTKVNKVRAEAEKASNS
jgi:spore cortex biosynthesis protein YabQ